MSSNRRAAVYVKQWSNGKRWVEHLHKRAEHTAQTYNEEMVDKILNTTYKTAMEDNLIPDRDELMKRIGTMIKFSNSTWSEKKSGWELPKNYFDG